MELNICHLYPDILNLYGDRGNILCMRKRLAWRGIDVNVDEVSIGQKLEASKYDLLFIGGGQDFEQEVLLPDLRGAKTEELKAAIEDNLPVLAICGGYQMLGRIVSDPEQVEAAGVTEISGMGLLDMDTEFRGEKVQTQTRGVFHGVEGMLSGLNGLAYEGYEIHMGRSRQEMPALSGGGNVYGSYVHGIFDAPGIADTILRALCARKGVSFDALATFDARGYKERQYDLLADVVRGGLDMSFVYRVLRREV